MDFYIDLILQGDEEIPIYFIRNKVFIKLHKALYDLKESSIGISFPKYKTKLGNIIRIHGQNSSLNALQQDNWLGGLIGYCQVSDILPIPEKIRGYQTISRIRQNMSHAKLQRLLKRDTIPTQDIKPYKIKMITEGLDNAYFELKSTSNKQLYRRYIQFGELNTQAVKGKFDSFGLSKTGTVPIF
jgi:CRISPR-associated endonuclease Csy4